MTPNQYDPEQRAALAAYAAYASLGAEIVALQQEAAMQRERADEMQQSCAAAQRDAARQWHYAAELEIALRAVGLDDKIAQAVARADSWRETREATEVEE